MKVIELKQIPNGLKIEDDQCPMPDDIKYPKTICWLNCKHYGGWQSVEGTIHCHYDEFPKGYLYDGSNTKVGKQ